MALLIYSRLAMNRRTPKIIRFASSLKVAIVLLILIAAYIVIDPGRTNLKKYTLLTEREYRELKEAYEDDFEAGMGAEAVKKLSQEEVKEIFLDNPYLEEKILHNNSGTL